MAKVALIRDGVAVNVLDEAQLADSFPPDHAEDFKPVPDNVQVFWRQAKDGRWSAPDAPPGPPEVAPPAVQRLLPVGLFLVRMPFPKLAAVYAARDADPGIGAILVVLNSLNEVDLNDVHTGEMLDYLVSKSLITAGDKAVMLA